MRVPTSRAVASRLRSLRSMPLYWFFPGGGARARGAAWGSAGRRSRGAAAPETASRAVAAARALSAPARRLVAGLFALQPQLLWEHGVVSHVEHLPGQSARAGCVRGGHPRPRTCVAAAPARSGPPASTASEASRGPFLSVWEKGGKSFLRDHPCKVENATSGGVKGFSRLRTDD